MKLLQKWSYEANNFFGLLSNVFLSIWKSRFCYIRLVFATGPGATQKTLKNAIFGGELPLFPIRGIPSKIPPPCKIPPPFRGDLPRKGGGFLARNTPDRKSAKNPLRADFDTLSSQIYLINFFEFFFWGFLTPFPVLGFFLYLIWPLVLATDDFGRLLGQNISVHLFVLADLRFQIHLFHNL